MEKNTTDQWTKINGLNDKIDEKMGSLFTRVNVLIGGIAIACVMLAVNLIVKR